ncbi:anthrone oxygenase family protein [Actinoplanes sp. NPDC049118]|uniref:anthrone oxygenase family protein n=1 Tax=Actinoplanes sp. NPDC049118 TaxID=3155769 RepID=UPI0033CB7992
MDALRTVALLAATLTTAMMAGLFHAYSCSVMPALRGADAAVLVEVMQRINRAILNGWFALCFAGALIFGVVAVVLVAIDGDTAVLVPAAAGLAVYIAQLVVTARIHIPLNNGLDEAGSTDPAAAREAYERPWVRWNHVRTALCAAAAVCWCWALLQS